MAARLNITYSAYRELETIPQTPLRRLMGGTFVRVVAWYDNEWGFSNRMADTAVAMGKLG